MYTGQFNVDNGPSIAQFQVISVVVRLTKPAVTGRHSQESTLWGRSGASSFHKQTHYWTIKFSWQWDLSEQIVEDGGAWVNIPVVIPNSIKYRCETVNLVYVTHHQCHKHQHEVVAIWWLRPEDRWDMVRAGWTCLFPCSSQWQQIRRRWSWRTVMLKIT